MDLSIPIILGLVAVVFVVSGSSFMKKRKEKKEGEARKEQGGDPR